MSADTQAPEPTGQPTETDSSPEVASTTSSIATSPTTEAGATTTTEVAATETSGTEEKKSETTPETASPETAAAEAATSEEVAAEKGAVDAVPSQRIQIGTQRDADAADVAQAKPVNPGSSTPREAEPTKSNYPNQHFDPTR